MVQRDPIPACDGQPLDEQALQKLQDELPGDEILYDLAELFRVLAIPPASRFCTPCLRANCASTTLPRWWGCPRAR